MGIWRVVNSNMKGRQGQQAVWDEPESVLVKPLSICYQEVLPERKYTRDSWALLVDRDITRFTRNHADAGVPSIVSLSVPWHRPVQSIYVQVSNTLVGSP